MLNNYFLIVATLPMVFSAVVNAQNLIIVFFLSKFYESLEVRLFFLDRT